MRKRYSRLKTAVIVGLASLSILVGLVVGTARLIDLAAPGYRNDLANWVGERLRQPLRIGAMNLRWSWTGPVLHLDHVALLDVAGKRRVMRLQTLTLHFDFRDLLQGRLMPDGVALTGPRVNVYRDDQGRLRLRGLQADTTAQAFDLAQATRWLDQLGHVRIVGGKLRLDASVAGRRLQLSNVNLRLRSHDQQHRVIASASLPPAYGESVHLRIAARGSPDHLAQMQGHGNLNLQGLRGARLLAAVGVGDADNRGGRAQLDASAAWRAGTLTAGQARLSAEPITRGAESHIKTLTPALALQASLHPEPGGLGLRIDKLRGDMAGLQHSRARARLDFASGRIEGVAQQLPAPLAAAALRLFAPARFAHVHADGNIAQLTFGLNWRHPAATVAADFRDIRISNPSRGLRLGRIDGHAGYGPKGANLRLDRIAGTLASNRFLHGALAVNGGSGRIAWQPRERVIRLSDLQLKAADSSISGGGRITLPVTGAPRADLSFQAASSDVSVPVAYIPQTPDLPNPRLRDWLSKALKGGRLQAAKLRLRGPLDRFPFADGGGQFVLTMRASAVDIDYKHGWPPLQNFSGQLRLAGNTLTIHTDRGRILDVAVDAAQARIPDVRQAVMSFAVQVKNARAPRLLAFLSHSPLRDKFGQLVRRLDLAGRADLTLDMTLPLVPGPGDERVQGNAKLRGVTLNQPGLPDPIENIRGNLRFDRHGLSAKQLRGSFSGLPLRATLTPGANGVLNIAARFALHLPADRQALTGLIPEPVLARAHGQASWHAELDVTRAGQSSAVILTSDLTGMALDLPAPLGKPAPTAAPIRVTLAANRKQLHVHFGHRVKLRTTLGPGRRGTTAVFGDLPAVALTGPGLWLSGNLPVVEVSQWVDLIADFDDRPNAKGKADRPPMSVRGIQLNLAGVRANGRRLGPIAVDTIPLAAEDGWQATITGSDGGGTIRWLQRAGRPHLVVDLQHLNLTTETSKKADDAAAKPENKKRPPLDPAHLPTLDLTVDDLKVDGHRLGRLQAETGAIDTGTSLNHLTLDHGPLRITAYGRWLRRAQGSQAAAHVEISGKGIKDLIRAAGFAPNLTSDKAKIEADINIAPSPDGLTLAGLNGYLHFDLEDGSLLTVDPGAARVLGLINFYALPRRLLLNFRDVLGKGTAFDSLRGDFNITDGQARTDNLHIHTPSAVVKIKGRIGLAQRDYDEHVTVIPKLSSVPAIAGTVLGGPAVGAAVFLVQRLLRKPIAKLSRVKYHLVGSWDNPQIKQVAKSSEDQ